MRETYGLPDRLGLQSLGVYAAGFDSYIDNFVFTLALVLGKFNLKLAQQVGGQLLYHHIKNKSAGAQVELMVKASGLYQSKPRKAVLSMYATSGFSLTSQSVTAFLHQYFDHTINKPGLYLMGEIADEKRLIDDLRKMGYQIQLSL